MRLYAAALALLCGSTYACNFKFTHLHMIDYELSNTTRFIDTAPEHTLSEQKARAAICEGGRFQQIFQPDIDRILNSTMPPNRVPLEFFDKANLSFSRDWLSMLATDLFNIAWAEEQLYRQQEYKTVGESVLNVAWKQCFHKLAADDGEIATDTFAKNCEKKILVAHTEIEKAKTWDDFESAMSYATDLLTKANGNQTLASGKETLRVLTMLNRAKRLCRYEKVGFVEGHNLKSALNNDLMEKRIRPINMSQKICEKTMSMAFTEIVKARKNHPESTNYAVQRAVERAVRVAEEILKNSEFRWFDNTDSACLEILASVGGARYQAYIARPRSRGTFYLELFLFRGRNQYQIVGASILKATKHECDRERDQPCQDKIRLAYEDLEKVETVDELVSALDDAIEFLKRYNGAMLRLFGQKFFSSYGSGPRDSGEWPDLMILARALSTNPCAVDCRKQKRRDCDKMCSVFIDDVWKAYTEVEFALSYSSISRETKLIIEKLGKYYEDGTEISWGYPMET